MPEKKKTLPPQHQDRQPGLESLMDPPPQFDDPTYHGSGKLEGKVALVTGGDSGIGRAVAVAFAKEGADLAIAYLDEHEDAEFTKGYVEDLGAKCLLIPGDLREESHCREVVRRSAEEYGSIDVLVNNAGEQHRQTRFEDISTEQLESTFRTNILAYFHLAKAALPHMTEGSSIINTASVTAFRGSWHLVDYAATKGAIVAFTRSLALNLVERKIRVNAVAPGAVWTPLIPASFPDAEVEKFGAKDPMERPAQPQEIAPSYVFLASADASFVTGQTIHPNGGEIING